MKAVSTKIKQINHLGGIKKLDLLRINTFSEMSMSVLIETFSGALNINIKPHLMD